MSSTYAELLDRLTVALDELAAIDPVYRTVGEKQEALVRLAAVKARVAAEELRILAAADDIAETTGARSTAAWVAEATGRRTGPYAGVRRWPAGWTRPGPRSVRRWGPGR
jgi:hypothetical protein